MEPKMASPGSATGSSRDCLVPKRQSSAAELDKGKGHGDQTEPGSVFLPDDALLFPHQAHQNYGGEGQHGLGYLESMAYTKGEDFIGSCTRMTSRQRPPGSIFSTTP
jgi:hypothetical protein